MSTIGHYRFPSAAFLFSVMSVAACSSGHATSEPTRGSVDDAGDASSTSDVHGDETRNGFDSAIGLDAQDAPDTSSAIDAFGDAAIDSGTADPFAGPDLCGNGLDDDSNGVVDDGCTAPSCKLAVNTFELPTETFDDEQWRDVAFDGAHSKISSTAGRESSENWLRIFSLDDGHLIEQVAGASPMSGSALHVPGGWFTAPWSVAFWHEPNVWFDDDLKTTELPGTGDGLMGSRRVYSDGLFYASQDTSGGTAWRTYDRLLTADPMIITPMVLASSATHMANAGGLPMLVSLHLDESTPGVPNSYRAEHVALGRGAVRWHGAVTSGSFYGSIAISDPARYRNEVMACAGGTTKTGGSTVIRMECSFEDAHTGLPTRPVVQKDLPLATSAPAGQRTVPHVIPLADGWGILRTTPNFITAATTPATSATLDYLHADGTYEANVLSFDYPSMAVVFSIAELGPNRFAVLAQTSVTAMARKSLVSVVGCAP